MLSDVGGLLGHAVPEVARDVPVVVTHGRDRIGEHDVLIARARIVARPSHEPRPVRVGRLRQVGPVAAKGRGDGLAAAIGRVLEDV